MKQQVEILTRAFRPDEVRHRPGKNGEDVAYLEGHVVIDRLNEAFDHAWTWSIDHHQILDDEVVVLGTLTAQNITKSAFGCSAITRSRDGGKAVSIGSDLKAAATDALKKSATLLGVGLTLHAAASPPARAPESPRSPTTTNGSLSAAQLRAIHALRKRLGWSEGQLADFASRHAGATDVEKLDKRRASTLIERLQAEAAPVGASP